MMSTTHAGETSVPDIAMRQPTILFENDEVVVIDKPSGISVHAGVGDNHRLTVAQWLLARSPQVKGVGEPQTDKDGTPLERSGVVHRLDTDTSGVLVLAKTARAYTHLKQQFHDRLVAKEYQAFVYGTMNALFGTIDRSIGRSARDFRLRSAGRGARGMLRTAVTNWRLRAQNSTHACLTLSPETGRTHQLRVHLKAVGRPIVGDPLYAPEAYLNSRSDLGIGRLALHAHRLTFTLPCGAVIKAVAPLPGSFLKALALLEQGSAEG